MSETTPESESRSRWPEPPEAERRPQTLNLHGESREDPYAWLRVENWQQVMRDPSLLDPEVHRHLETENAYTETVLEPVRGLRRALVEEMKARLEPEEHGVPDPDGEFAYYSRFNADAEHPTFCRRPVLGDGELGPEEVILDGDAEAQGHAYFRLAACMHSPDHRILAYARDTTGSEFCEIRFRDMETGETLPDVIEDANGDLVWANDSRTLLYVGLDENHRPCRIHRHKLGQAGEDPLIYSEEDPGFFLGLGKTESHRFLLLDAHDHTTSEVRVIPADDPESKPRLIAARTRDLRYEVSEHDGRFLILTNADGAEDFKLAQAPLETPGRENWQDVIPHEAGRLIVATQVFKDHLVLLERVGGLPRLTVRRFSDGAEHRVAFDEASYSLGLAGGYEYETTRLRFAYSSPRTPQQVFDYDMESRERVLRKEQKVPSGHDPLQYRVERLTAQSHDGAEVPITLLYRADTPLDGSAPLLLYGYGSYGLTYPARFATQRLSLVDRGFVYAIAHIRGGMDKGYAWYREGKLMKKQNTFRDFIACAEHLVDRKIAQSGNIAIHGGSAGGMLVAAVANMRPELLRAVVAEVPFVDVLNTMSDPELPLTPPEWPEWGNPIDDEAAYRYIREYSPYDNVVRQAYPHVLATAGLSDPRVTYWEPAKWVARLRERKTNDALVLLHTQMSAGHGGASGRYKSLEDDALVFAFLLMIFGRAAG